MITTDDIDYSIVNKRFGSLVVTKLDHITRHGNPHWLCKCDCGNDIVTSNVNLILGRVKSCGCKPRGKIMEDLTDKRFERLTVLEYAGKSNQNESLWLCKCDCGNEKIIRGTNLKNGMTTSCGCRKHERRSEELTGKRFGHLYVIGFDHAGKKGVSYWKCECDCGNISVVRRSSLLNGSTRSCGCGSKVGMIPAELVGETFGELHVIGLDCRNRKIGTQWICKCSCGNTVLRRTRELLNGRSRSCGCIDGLPTDISGMSCDSLYNIWCGVRQRCENPNSPAYNRYGGRGISVCNAWAKYENFRDWALRNGYRDELTIDRIDNNGDYTPDNCRWVDYFAQENNRSTNRLFTYNGSTHTVAEWARILGVNYERLRRHIINGDYSMFETYFNFKEE